MGKLQIRVGNTGGFFGYVYIYQYTLRLKYQSSNVLTTYQTFCISHLPKGVLSLSSDSSQLFSQRVWKCSVQPTLVGEGKSVEAIPKASSHTPLCLKFPMFLYSSHMLCVKGLRVKSKSLALLKDHTTLEGEVKLLKNNSVMWYQFSELPNADKF